MQSTIRIEVPARLSVLVTLAQLLERFERAPAAIPPEQYRSVVGHLVREIGTVEHDDTFRRLLDVFPATSELYENLQYGHAGLCRSPLEAALEAEAAARDAIARVARTARR